MGGSARAFHPAAMDDEDRPLSHPGLSPETERARAVEAVLADQSARRDVRSRPPRGRRSTTRGRLAALVVVSTVAVWVWLAVPAWMSPSPPPPMPERLEEAALRMVVYLQAQRVELFRRDRGRLPDALEETGEPLPGVRYERLDSRTFRLHAVGRRDTLLYTSSTPLRAFAEGVDRVLGASD
ncbi:MAG: hypothetical protein PVI57_11350 [Gemmatimonadota bacterium]